MSTEGPSVLAREGNGLWLVYNEGMNLDRDRTDPMQPRTGNRTLLLQYTHSWSSWPTKPTTRESRSLLL